MKPGNRQVTWCQFTQMRERNLPSLSARLQKGSFIIALFKLYFSIMSVERCIIAFGRR
ncbi:hypothetical protein M670_00190 [Schinkia azotoformans MEV2011]|uniref:Uncharacterized protein n=1 Tax=Schinkia azotoformans MEV2011 TaxID=1348973 RepID=A0A072NR88_SCHAZ|nr:hypothetical protein M670_00190 [Schinkia azotoformans MEV2011]